MSHDYKQEVLWESKIFKITKGTFNYFILFCIFILLFAGSLLAVPTSQDPLKALLMSSAIGLICFRISLFIVKEEFKRLVSFFMLICLFSYIAALYLRYWH